MTKALHRRVQRLETARQDDDVAETIPAVYRDAGGAVVHVAQPERLQPGRLDYRAGIWERAA